MVTRKQICSKIESIHPDMGVCGRDYEVSFDRKQKAWSVDYHEGKHHLKTFLEADEADSCLEKDRCIPLALQVGQLKENFKKYVHEHALEKDN